MSSESPTESKGKQWFWRGAAISIWLINFLIFISLLTYVHDILKLPPRDDLNESAHADYANSIQPENSKVDIASGKANSQGYAIEKRHQKNQKAFEKMVNVRNLKAQEGMWAIAFLLAVITFFQFIASLIGLYLILGTYREAKNATNAATDTLAENIKANIPYLKLKSVRLILNSMIQRFAFGLR